MTNIEVTLQAQEIAHRTRRNELQIKNDKKVGDMATAWLYKDRRLCLDLDVLLESITRSTTR